MSLCGCVKPIHNQRTYTGIVNVRLLDLGLVCYLGFMCQSGALCGGGSGEARDGVGVDGAVGGDARQGGPASDPEGAVGVGQQ